ncbi:Na+/H+ antiporter subunit E [Micromonospora craniellae]|uniref:Sodium:proton antiporter n=1 Tax=Micromonospora craniellae TaxID=2294034 RepID=A0A372FUF4_9ACTN|nr:Na+/H+ antiporter subunit E [Micromonospora craniellae]QOC92192.1 Na+/H+ antiporter subunit E [Micromonospora craniellae]RFS44373.1 sodium:proton antiporter [Micromonospora craniellae]
MTRLLTLPIRLVLFALWFAGQIVRSSWTILADILTPGLATTPRVVRMPLDSRNDLHVALIGVLITLTPGTLTLGVVAHDQDGQALLVHSMYHPDTESALTDLRDMERRMLLAMSLGDPP